MAGKSIKHVKIKNTAILFEVLTRQLTSDIINGKENSIAKNLIEKYFNGNTELGKEYILYQALLKYKFPDNAKATEFLNEVLESHKKLNQTKIKKLKYSLVREIMNNYDVEGLFSNPIDNYKVLASIYKLFQAKSINNNILLPADVVNSKFTIIEHIMGKKADQKKKLSENDKKLELILSDYEKQNQDIRLLTYKILIENFNKKYKSLDERQKELLKQYINEIANSNSLLQYVQTELPNVLQELNTMIQNIKDKVTEIKLKEVAYQLSNIMELKEIKDEHVLAMLNVYELLKELKKVNDTDINSKSKNLDDPTKEEMLIVLHPEEDEKDDAEIAIYWFARNYNKGKDSNLYSILNNSPYKAGPTARLEDENDTVKYMYNTLVKSFTDTLEETSSTSAVPGFLTKNAFSTASDNERKKDILKSQGFAQVQDIPTPDKLQ